MAMTYPANEQELLPTYYSKRVRRVRERHCGILGRAVEPEWLEAGLT